jgi:hypothetical protein
MTKRIGLFVGMVLCVPAMAILSGCSSESAPLAKTEEKAFRAPVGSNEMPPEAKAAMEKARNAAPQGAPAK